MSKELKFVYVTMDGGHNAALRQAAAMLKEEHGITLNLALYRTSGFWDDATWQRFERDVNDSDFVFGCMIFSEAYVRPMHKILEASDTSRVIIISNPVLIYSTKIGKLELQMPDPEAEPGLIKRWMKKLRPKKDGKKEGFRQTAFIRNLTKMMKYVPGKVRDLHTFIAMHDYWLHATPENLKRQMCLLIDRYVPGYEGQLPVVDAIHFPEGAIYHPDAPEPFEDVAQYRAWRKAQGKPLANGSSGAWSGSVGLLTQRAIILSGNTDHLDNMIREIEAQGLEARTVYSAMLDFRPAMEEYHSDKHHMPQVDALVNTLGFPLVGGPAGSRPDEAIEALQKMDVGYFDAIPLGYQRVEDWQADDMGLNPMQVAMNIALPELDGIAEPVVFGGPTISGDKFIPNQREASTAARRIARRIRLKHKANAEKKLAVVVFNFPPNLGNAGTAAFLDVFASLYRLMQSLQAEGYQVDLPDSAEALRQQVVDGNGQLYGTDGNVAARLSLDDYRDNFPWHTEIEPFWGYAPGELLTDGKDFYILGKQFGNLFVGIQPSFGYERDPMRLLMGKDASPHHGFAAFYTWLEHIYDADAVIHFGTHGALEFMPGKQVGVGADCWSTRLIGSLPNFYYYCVNNPSEGSIAKRRSAATLISYMVPPLHQAGLYKGLRRLKDDVDTYVARPNAELLTDIRTQAKRLDIEPNLNGNAGNDSAYIAALKHDLMQIEHRMIPLGLHIVGTPPSRAELVDLLALTITFTAPTHPKDDSQKLPTLPAMIAHGKGWDYHAIHETMKTNADAQAQWEHIEATLHHAVELFIDAPRDPRLDTRTLDRYLAEHANIKPGLLVKLWVWLDDVMDRILHDQELQGMLHSLEGGYIASSPGNDVMRNAAIVPTGRNIHTLDPYRIPNATSTAAAQKIVDSMLERLTHEQGALPETVAMVLWGTDNLKSDGEAIAQCFTLLGARALEDELGNITDVELIPLAELGRPRIDVVMTLSGIFRDLFHHQSGLLDKAVRLAAEADEPADQNFVRKHTLEHMQSLNIPFEEATARVFTNAPGSYGAHVNHLVDSSTWDSDDQLSEAFLERKSYAYREGGQWVASRQVMERSLATVDAAFQNIDSFELGISDVDHYYEYLGGVAKSVEKLGGKRPAVLVADAIAVSDRISSLEGMVRLETRAKLLNPKWHESMLNHGYEGVREIEIRVSNTYGWSATADAVENWVYDDIATTFLLDEAMRQRMADANPHATAAIARRLLEAEARDFWDASDEMIDRLREIYGNLEDQMEGVVSAGA